MKEHQDPEEDDEEELPNRCDTCFGSGEVGPTGWEFPEWHTCPDCKGSGLWSEDDPDRKHDARIDWE